MSLFPVPTLDSHTPEELLGAAAFRLRAARRSEPDARATLLRRFKDTVPLDRFEIIFRTFYPLDGTSSAAEGISVLTDAERSTLKAHEESVRATDFVLRWEAYGTARTDAPPVFHTLGGLILISMATDRQLYLNMQFGPVFPSIYAVGLVESGGRKTTFMTYVEDVALVAFPDRILPTDYSTEGLFTAIATEITRETSKGPVTTYPREVSRGTLFVDEAGRMLNTMQKHGYAEGLKDLFADVWTCPELRQRQLSQKTITVKSVFINKLMITTISRFAGKVSPEDLESGWLARYLPVIPREMPPRKPLREATPDIDVARSKFAVELKGIRSKLAPTDDTGARPAPKPIPITPEAMARLDKAEVALEEWAKTLFDADLVGPWATRFSGYAQRLAILYTVSEGRDTIDVNQVLRAIAFVDQRKDDAVMLVEKLMESKPAKELEKAEKFIRANPGISRRDLMRRAHIKTVTDVDRLIQELQRQGRVSIRGSATSPTYYFLGPMEATA